jgi:hypothetical protein
MAMSQQSLLKFFGRQIEKPVEKRKNTPAVDENSIISLKNFKYDKDKRKRTFPVQWTKRFPWAKAETDVDGDSETMFCLYCRHFLHYPLCI